jgi:hypothetical protein
MALKKQLAKASDALVKAQTIESTIWAWGMAAAVISGLLYLIGRALYLAWH